MCKIIELILTIIIYLISCRVLFLTHIHCFIPSPHLGLTYFLPIFPHPVLTLTHTWMVLTFCPSFHTLSSPLPSTTPGWYLLCVHLLTPSPHPHPHPHLGGTYSLPIFSHPHPHPHLGGAYPLPIFSHPVLTLTHTHTWVVLTLCPSSQPSPQPQPHPDTHTQQWYLLSPHLLTPIPGFIPLHVSLFCFDNQTSIFHIIVQCLHS